MSMTLLGRLSTKWKVIAPARRTLILFGIAAGLLVAAATASLVSFPTATPRVQDWSGLLRYTGAGEAPFGWINATSFNIIKDDGQPAGQNISADMMVEYWVFFFAEGSVGRMRVLASDQGAYRANPFRANISAISISYFNQNFSYFVATNSNYKVSVFGTVSVHMHSLPWGGYPVFTANASKSGPPFSSLFEFAPVAAQSNVAVTGKGVVLVTNGTTTNLTGRATITVEGFSRAGLSVFETSQNYTMHQGTRLVFDSGSFDLRNLNGTIGSPQAGEISIHNATAKISSTTSAVIRMAYPITSGTRFTTIDFRVQGAILNLVNRGVPTFPGAEMTEATGITIVRAFTIGFMTFFGGFFLDRARVGGSDKRGPREGARP
jgi:hypothetical protein